MASVGLVLGFGSSCGLADAYGVAVTTTMAITTVLAFVVMRQRWGWRLAVALPVVAAFLLVDIAFMGSNALKIVHGGWFPLAIGVLGYVLLSTWRRGRELLEVRLEEISIPYADLLSRIEADPPAEVAGTAIYLTSSVHDVPPMILHNIRHNKVLHERVILLTISAEPVPRIPRVRRVEVRVLGADGSGSPDPEEGREIVPVPEGERFYRVIAHYGYMQQPDVPDILDRCAAYGLVIDPAEATFFLGRETLLATERPGMPLWREKLFAWLARNEVGATSAFGIPPERVVELGAQIEL
ncbi:MAG: KUP/HAK/KT family potassium transporter [Planctomycetota bacterium]